MLYKVLTPELKMLDDGAGVMSGYASTFSNWDSVGERPVKGAFAPHLSDFLRDGFIAIGHDWASLPVATPTDAYEDDHGLFLKAEFHSTPEAQAARTVTTERLARGKSVKLSIGYEVLKDDYVEGGRLLQDIKLYEVSLVTVPANPLASVTAAKGGSVSDPPFLVHLDSVVSAVERFTSRAQDRAAFRAKEGRVLSDANRKRIQSLLESLTSVQQELTDLLAATEPKDAAKDARKLYAEFLRIQAHIDGVLP